MTLGDLRLSYYPRLTEDAEDDAYGDPEFVTVERGRDCLHTLYDYFTFVVWARPALPAGSSQAGGRADPAPLAILSSYSGGAHCCTTLNVIFRDAAGIVKVQEIPTGNSDPAVDQDWVGGAPGITFGDDTFAYWNTSYATSPGGTIKLDWSPEGYRLSPDMITDAPMPEALQRIETEMRAAILAFGGPYRASTDPDAQNGAAPKTPLDPVVWNHLIDLIYSGHADIAAETFDRAWPREVDGKRVFWKDFLGVLAASRLWQPWHLADILDPGMTFQNE